jgi:lipid A disaccharide synthetase
LSCGEPSRPLLAGNLAKQIKALAPQVEILAVGGEALAQNKAVYFYDIKGLAVMGLLTFIKNIPGSLSLNGSILDNQGRKAGRGDPGRFLRFYLRLAKDIGNTTPVIYYVSPQILGIAAGQDQTDQKFIPPDGRTLQV